MAVVVFIAIYNKYNNNDNNNKHHILNHLNNPGRLPTIRHRLTDFFFIYFVFIVLVA